MVVLFCQRQRIPSIFLTKVIIWADKTLQQFTYQQGVQQLRRWSDLVHTGVKHFAKDWQGDDYGLSLCLQIQAHLPDLEQQLIGLEQLVEQLLLQSQGTNQPMTCYRFANGVVPEALRQQATSLSLLNARLESDLDKLCHLIDKINKGERQGLSRQQAETYLSLIGGWLLANEQQCHLWHAYTRIDNPGEAPMARWIQYRETPQHQDIELAASPILASKLLQHHLWQHCYATVLTSATLMALGRFDQLLMYTGLPQASTMLALTSPLAYGASTLCMPPEAVEPGPEAVFVQDLVKLLPSQLNQAEATLVLFTSRRVMQQVFDDLTGDWQDLNFTAR